MGDADSRGSGFTEARTNQRAPLELGGVLVSMFGCLSLHGNNKIGTFFCIDVNLSLINFILNHKPFVKVDLFDVNVNQCILQHILSKYKKKHTQNTISTSLRIITHRIKCRFIEKKN